VLAQYELAAYGVRHVGDSSEVAIPQRLQAALDTVGTRIGMSFSKWLDRFLQWQIVTDDSFGFGLIGLTDYLTQSTKFYTWETEEPANLTTDELAFVVAHEFGHLLPQNAELVRSQSVGAPLSNGPRPEEVDADRTARLILELDRNPGKFVNRPVE
jgi:hypothetical protein